MDPVGEGDRRLKGICESSTKNEKLAENFNFIRSEDIAFPVFFNHVPCNETVKSNVTKEIIIANGKLLLL